MGLYILLAKDENRQKDDLRLLISKRILSVYSAMQTVTTGKKSEIPLKINSITEICQNTKAISNVLI